MRKRNQNRARREGHDVLPSMGVRAGAGVKVEDEVFELPFFDECTQCFVHFRSGEQVDACMCLSHVLGMKRGT